MSKPFVQSASWIWSAEGIHSAPAPEAASPSHYQVRYFRRDFSVRDPAACALAVHVSADSRFLFFCNGTLVGRGPAKGDVNHQFYDTFHLTEQLRAGNNALAALVFDMSRVALYPTQLGAPGSVMSYAGGFVLEGSLVDLSGAVLEDLHTDATWKVAIDRGYRFQNENTRFEGYHGYFEHRVSRLIPDGWTGAGFDDSAWPQARVLYKAERWENRRDPASPYGLTTRMIPSLAEEEPKPFAAAFAPGGGAASADWSSLVRDSRPLVLGPGAKVDLILDVGSLTTAFPSIAVSGGAGSVVRLTYAEALRLPWDTPGATLFGRRQSLANLASVFADETTGWTFDRRGAITGWSDIWEPAGRDETFEPWHWRAFQFVGLRIEVGSEAMTVRSLSHRFTGYPYRISASFSSSDSRLDRIWPVGLRTMRLCAHETFEDGPHYEQMQYAGDSMITSLIGLLASGDVRLSRQALHHFDWSRLSDGLTQARYPCRLVQIIPSWSLHWITTARDYLLFSGDVHAVKEIWPGVRSVLDWFRRHTDGNGLPAALPYWNITDWCPWWPRGVVPGADSGPVTIIASQYIVALDEAAWIARHLGLPAEAAALASEAASLRPRLHAVMWSEAEGLYFDRPGGPEVSQYGNAWAVIAGVAGPRERERLAARFPLDPALAPGSFFCWHTVFAALRLCGRYDEMPRYLGPWQESIDYGLSTFVEENSYWRSMCHAWSAHPVIEFLTGILGVMPTEPGFARVSVAPHRCGLDHAAGRVCTPRGPIDVAWRAGDGRFALTIAAPVGMPVDVTVPGGSKRSFAGGRFEETFPLA
jgi:alpha-L-rhamnosidase